MATQSVEEHYSQGGLLDRIRTGLAALGATEPLEIDLLAPVDEFHIGGRLATEPLIAALDLGPASKVIDLGCGLGGPARFTAHATGAQVTGIDLTPEFVDTGTALTAMAGLKEKVTLTQGSILDLPFNAASFDAAYMIHVGMNIADKARLISETRRVLRPGGRFAIYDVMLISDEPLEYPLPWASAPDQNAISAPGAYRAELTAAGFQPISETDRTDFAKDFFARVAASQAAAGGPPPLGLHLVMGANTAAKVGNMVANIRAGRIAPVEMIWQKPFS